MSTTVENRSAAARVNSDANDRRREHVAHCIDDRLSGCSYSFYFNKIEWTFENGRLTLHGCVPSYYMKQMLQTLLRDIEYVKQIDNDVDVVSATGLSSVKSPVQ